MKRKLSFTTAWAIFILVAITLVVLNFMDDEQARNEFAGIVLAVCAVLFIVAVLLRGLTDRIG
jgi:membrane-bound ClpP family serine protease